VEAEAVADALETGVEAPLSEAPTPPDAAGEAPTVAALPETAEPELADAEEFPSAEAGASGVTGAAAETETATEEAPEAEEPGTEASDAESDAAAPPRKRRRERRRTRPKKETAPPEAEGDEGTPEEGTGALAPASEEGEEAPPELAAEEAELLGALDRAEGSEETGEAVGEDTEEEDDENGAETEGESAASRGRKRRRRRRRRSGLTLREEAPIDEAGETAVPDLADAEAELVSAETGADLETEEDVEAGIEQEEILAEEEDEEPAASPSEDGSATERRARRSRLPNRRDGRRRPAMEQAVIENPTDPGGSPLRVDIQPGVGTRLIGRSIIGFREAYDIGGGDRAAVSFHVMVLDDGSQWRVKGSDDFDPWFERILPGEDD
jgi:hypothetical protein